MITHKGYKALLDHHALHPVDSSDEDVKNCIDANIKNSDAPTDEEGSDIVTNRDTADEVERLKAEKAALVAKLKEKPAVLHNRNDSSQPNIEIEENELDDELKGKISNRAAELEKKGIPAIPAYNRAYKELTKKKK